MFENMRPMLSLSNLLDYTGDFFLFFTRTVLVIISNKEQDC